MICESPNPQSAIRNPQSGAAESALEMDLFAPTTVQKFTAWADSPGGRQVLRIAYAIAARFARRYHARGRRVSMKLIWEELRDNVIFIRARMKARGIMLDKIDGFALNNNFHALVARHIISHRPEWAGLFEFRELGAPHKKRKVIVIEERA